MGNKERIRDVLHQVADGQRLSYDDGLLLYQEADLYVLAEAATARRYQLNPDRAVTYLIDRNINYTNVCVTDCSFCNFYAAPGSPKGYVLSKAVIGHKIEQLLRLGGTRILMQGGHNPDLPFSFYTDLIAWIHSTYPTLDINAFSPSEIDYVAKLSDLDWRTVLTELKQAGLAGLPGGGGEILDDEIRARVSPKKIRTQDWLGVMKVAHELHLVTTATMVVGFRETLQHRLNHLEALRREQDDSLKRFGTGWNTFISWPVQIEGTALGRSRFADEYGAGAEEALRHTAISRLYLDNIAHITASWPTLGTRIGVIALRDFGCDDFGGTMIEENVVSSAGAITRVQPAVEPREIHRLVRSCGFIPVQRDSAYHVIRRYEDPRDDAALPVLADLLANSPNVSLIN